MRFLATYPDQAFTQSEILDATDVNAGSISVVLSHGSKIAGSFATKVTTGRLARPTTSLPTRILSRARGPRTTASVRRTWTNEQNTPSTTRTRRLNELSARGCRLGPDPFKSGENPRPWLILNNDTHPFGEEEYMTVTLTTTPHDEGIPLEDADWVEGRDAPTELRLTVGSRVAEARRDHSTAGPPRRVVRPDRRRRSRNVSRTTG